ncbi:ComEA family DNA-binding protein [Sulfuriflexus mobilis]|uniref:ComEA family DNA-binding protein n=1 Tax=Sulfuriflexus mobilis TaxID=1811807 RepID=UPI000F820204|nr:ComEA family DNA-binding protein [Sulfuriflexus mobilis]
MNHLRRLIGAFALLLSTAVFAIEPVDINSADALSLAQAIQGVGQAKAEAIVAYRTKNGRFASVDDLAKVKGIGLQTVAKNRDRLTTGAKTAAVSDKK